MKKIILFLVIASSLSYADNLSVPSKAAHLQTVHTFDGGFLTQIKTRIPLIIEQVKVISPKLQEIVRVGAAGGVSGFINSFVSGALDTTTRDAAIKLITILTATNTAVESLAKMPTDSDKAKGIKDDAKTELSKLITNKNVQELLANAKQIPLVGEKLHTALQKLLTDATKL